METVFAQFVFLCDRLVDWVGAYILWQCVVVRGVEISDVLCVWQDVCYGSNDGERRRVV